jgi:tetratricopeptide (TPR) repeat protein
MENLRASVASHIRTARTPAEKLRVTLGLLEAQVGKLGHGMTTEPVELLLTLDQAYALLHELDELGAELSGERARFETVTQQYRRKGKLVLKSVGGRSAFQQVRAAQPRTPPEANWWWYIDDVLSEERRTRRIGSLRSLGIAAAVMAVVTALYMLFLMPDEATRMRYRYEQAAEQSLMVGDPAAALPSIEEALTYAPDNGELLLLRAVTFVLLDRPEEADAAFAEARSAFGDDKTFYASRTQAYMIGNRPDLALQDAQRQIEIAPADGLGYFQLGNAHGMLGNYGEAVVAYETAGELARAAGEIELEGMSRVQLANLMMLMMSPQMELGNATPDEVIP